MVNSVRDSVQQARNSRVDCELEVRFASKTFKIGSLEVCYQTVTLLVEGSEIDHIRGCSMKNEPSDVEIL
jgi:hypothetical protein